MQYAELVKRFAESHLTGDWETFEALTTSDFAFTGPAPEPLDKVGFLAWIQSMFDANDELDNNLSVIEDDGHRLTCSVQVQGKHTRDWNLGFLGLGVVAPTGVSWKNPQETMTVTVRDGRIAAIHVEVSAGGGISGICRQIGVQMPS